MRTDDDDDKLLRNKGSRRHLSCLLGDMELGGSGAD